MNILKKIQNLPENKKKIIFWLVLIILGLSLFFFLGKNIDKKFQNLNVDVKKFWKELNFPKLSEFQEEIKNIPQPSEDSLKKMEELIKEIGEQQKNINNNAQEPKTETIE